jgi:hypothetical protein
MEATYKSGIWLVLGLFAIIYSRSLTFVYIEGDDATSISYHALGRNANLEPPYSAYQSMMDGVLRVLPPKEPVLRVTAMLITALAAPVLVLLIGVLAFEWAGELAAIPWALGAIFIPLAAPELAFLGLVYTPAMVAMAAAVGAHVMVRRALTRRKRGWRDGWLWGAAVLLGAGVACRWDVAAYGAVVAADMWLGPGWEGRETAGSGRRRFALAAAWGVAAAATWLAAVALNGYGPAMVWKAIRASGPVESTPGLLVAAATAQTFFTPAMGLLALAGFAVLLKRRHRLAVPVVVGIVLTARFARFGVPKWFLAAVPGIVTCALIGLSVAWQHWQRRWRAIGMRAAIGALVLVPWAVGVRTVFGDSAYGPGFQVQPFDRAAPEHPRIRAALGGGALVPTSEGPRPVGGYGWVLVGGGWREIALAHSADLQRAVGEAIATGRPLLQDEGEGYATATLAGMNFSTRDSWKRTIGDAFLVERRFSSADGRSVRVLRLRDRDSLFAAADVSRLRQLAGTDTVIIFGYTSTLRRCYKLAPDSLTKLGNKSAQLDLDRLEARLTR